MSVAWTTVVVLALLLPGISFFGGLYSSDRFPRDFGRNSPFSDIGLAIFAAAAIHFLFILGLIVTSWTFEAFSLSANIKHVAETFSTTPTNYYEATRQLSMAALYLIATPAIAFVAGRILTVRIFSGFLGNVARHQWIRDLVQTQKTSQDYNKAYVVTTLGHDGTHVMYEGYLKEFFFTREGKVAYLVLQEANRFHMTISNTGVATETQINLPIISETDTAHATRRRYKPYLMIEGDSIHNVVFRQIGDLTLSRDAEAALEQAVSRHRAGTDAHPAP